MSLYVNRLLNMKKIKVIGFDMDYTLVRYHTELFEELTHSLACQKLVSRFSYPTQVGQLKFDMDRSIGGLVIDRRNGNLLKLSRFGKVKISFNGLVQIGFREQTALYQDLAIDVSGPDFRSLDTAFAISTGVLYSQLVQLKKDGVSLPNFSKLSDDIGQAIDEVHQDGSIKNIVTEDFKKYVVSEPKVSQMLELYKSYGKELMIITNSDYNYSKKLLDYAINPYLKHHKRWEEVFGVVITLADKPAFFQQSSRFLRVTDESGTMENHFGPVKKGIYQGGCFEKLQNDLGVHGWEILYLGDHIYGDVVSIKKRCGWRTALVLEDLEKEMESMSLAKGLQDEIDSLMEQKSSLERDINKIDLLRHEGEKIAFSQLDKLHGETDRLNSLISEKLVAHKAFFNPYWGEVLRAGSDESRFADQVERYACIYMKRVSDLLDFSPKTYFRPERRILPHESL